jgi:branched-subunit amino acid aminotransferase/4-amino-4-deoxychorismate lyase
MPTRRRPIDKGELTTMTGMTTDQELSFLRANCERLQKERDRLAWHIYDERYSQSRIFSHARRVDLYVRNTIALMTNNPFYRPADEIIAAIAAHDRHVLLGERPPWEADPDARMQIEKGRVQPSGRSSPHDRQEEVS